jgi:hypothetical protein
LAHQISLDGIDLADSQKVGQAGDSITVLATFRTCGTREQWLTELKIARPTAKEIAAEPAENSDRRLEIRVVAAHRSAP